MFELPISAFFKVNRQPIIPALTALFYFGCRNLQLSLAFILISDNKKYVNDFSKKL